MPMQASALRAERAGTDRLSARSTPVTAAVAQAPTEHSIVITAGTESSCCTCMAANTCQACLKGVPVMVMQTMLDMWTVALKVEGGGNPC